jgi:peptidase C25-like protein/flagellar hook capping protein FlgD
VKRTVILLLIVLTISLLSGELTMNSSNDGLHLSYKNDDLLNCEENLTSIVALPSESVEIEIINCEVISLSSSGEILETRNSAGDGKVEVIDNFVMRELYGHTLKINLKDETRSGSEIINQLDFRVRPVNRVQIPQSISMVFEPLYKLMVDNYEESYLRDAELLTPKMLIITPPQIVGSLQPFIEWKNERGIATQIATLEETGSTAPEIKNYIQDLYDTAETPPDYIVIFGDGDDGFFVVPAFFINSTGEIDVTDHPYTLLEGDDYFPEMIIGRISIDTTTELQRIITKILSYEKTPYMDSNWFENGLIVAGNYSSSPPIPTTPVKVSKWLRDKMYDYGYNNITEVYYPPTNDGTTEINNAFNSGVGFVSYRGWGDANGWHKPEYHIEDMANLNNGFQLPIMTSIVCNTGDFVNSVDPCFGEAMLRAHVGTVPKGAVAVVAPSDLHTSTKYNNAIFSGFYSGVLDEGIYSFGAAVLRGKYELYNNYPLNWEPGDYVEFYFHVYNILGDPSIQMWTKTPQEMGFGETLPDQIGMGTNYLEVLLPGLDGTVVTATQGDEFFNAVVSSSGRALIILDGLTMGELKITAVRPNYLPIIETIDVVQNNVDIGIEEYSTNIEMEAGNDLTFSVTLKNYGTETSSGFDVVLSSENEFITINNGNINYSPIAAASTATNDFELNIAADCPDGEIVELDFDLGQYGDGKIVFAVNSLIFEVTEIVVNDANGIADPGETVEIGVTIFNDGSFDAVDLQAEVVALSDAVNILAGSIDFGSVAVNTEASGSFTVEVDPNCLIGRTVSFRLDLTEAGGRETQAVTSIEIGEVDNIDPTFSTSMDYFAYDSFDTGYAEVPTYSWLEIDPQEGGDGSVTLMPDDESESYALPFTFTYYGIDYDSLTICTNGWISFETTWMTLFRNWNIPAAIGPYAMVAPFWDDLIGVPYMVNDTLYHHDMRICRYYNESDNTFIIEWNECLARFDDATVEKFQIVLFDPAYYPTADGNGEIQFNYHTIENVDSGKNYATVGIEDHTQMNGVLYTYANIYPASATELQNEMAIKFTTDPPDDFVSSEDPEVIPDLPHLQGNYPNPFNPITTISFSLPESAQVEMEIYNVKGQLVRILAQDEYSAGAHEIIWNGKDEAGKSVTSGIYYYRLNAAGTVQTRKCVLLK